MKAISPALTAKAELIFNAIDCAALDRPKLAGAEFNLGMIGINPRRKRLDLAFDVLEALRRRDRRYTLFVKAAGGAINVSYEGIRCETREQKYYAIGRSGGGWSRARDPAWRYIEVKEFNRHHGILHGDFFCNGKEPVKTARMVVDALKYGSPHPRYNIRY